MLKSPHLKTEASPPSTLGDDGQRDALSIPFCCDDRQHVGSEFLLGCTHLIPSKASSIYSRLEYSARSLVTEGSTSIPWEYSGDTDNVISYSNDALKVSGHMENICY